jgi:hypothetical protein
MQARSDAYQQASSRVSHLARTRVRQDWHSPQRADHRSSESPTSSCDTALTADDPHTGHRWNSSAPDGLKSRTHRRCSQARAPRREVPARRQPESHSDMQRGQHAPARAASVEAGRAARVTPVARCPLTWTAAAGVRFERIRANRVWVTSSGARVTEPTPPDPPDAALAMPRSASAISPTAAPPRGHGARRVAGFGN